MCSVRDDAHDRVQHFDILMQSSPDIDSQVPCTVEILHDTSELMSQGGVVKGLCPRG